MVQSKQFYFLIRNYTKQWRVNHYLAGGVVAIVGGVSVGQLFGVCLKASATVSIICFFQWQNAKSERYWPI